MRKEEIKQTFIETIEGSYPLNLAISVLEDREQLQQENENLIKLYTEECGLRHELDLKLDIEKQKTSDLIKYLEDKRTEYLCSTMINLLDKIRIDSLVNLCNEILDKVKEGK